MARQRRRFSMEFKQEAVRLMKEKGVPITQVARDLGVDRSVLRQWTEKDAVGELVEAAPPLARPKPDLEEEVRRIHSPDSISPDRFSRVTREDAPFHGTHPDGPPVG